MAENSQGVSSPRVNVYSSCRGGYTLVELLVYLVIAVVLVASVYQVLIGQNRLYSKQQGLQDVRATLRSTASFLAWELRQLSASGGDVYSAGIYDLVIRSIQGGGLVCAIDEATYRYGLIDAEGEFSATSNDSVLVFSEGRAGSTDDAWVTAVVSDVLLTGGGGPTCHWGDSTAVATEVVIELTPDSLLAGIDGGAPVRFFRRTHYGIFLDGGRWWLGRKVGDEATFEKMTGPLAAPPDSGLVFSYYDSSGNVTADPSQIEVVDICVRGESARNVRHYDGTVVAAQEDSLTLRVHLRG